MVDSIGGSPSARALSGSAEAQTFRSDLQNIKSQLEHWQTKDKAKVTKAMTDITATVHKIDGDLKSLQAADRLYEIGGQDIEDLVDVLDQVVSEAGKLEVEVHHHEKWKLFEVLSAILLTLLLIVPGVMYIKDRMAAKDYTTIETPADLHTAHMQLRDKTNQLEVKVKAEKTRLEYFETRQGTGQLNQPDAIETTGSADQAVDALSKHLLRQQSMLRDPSSGRVTGKLGKDHLTVQGPDGKVALTDAGMREAHLRGFKSVGSELELAADLFKDGSITPIQRDEIASNVIDTVLKGYEVAFDNLSGRRAGEKLTLTATKDGVRQTRQVDQATTRSDLKFHRGAEVIPRSDPAQTFDELMGQIADMDPTATDYADTIAKLNDTLHTGFLAERESQTISSTLSFQQYKMQFLQLKSDGVTKDGIRWHDGDGDLTAAEWSFLHLRVADMPQESKQWYTLKVEYKGAMHDLSISLNKPDKDVSLDDIKQHVKDNYAAGVQVFDDKIFVGSWVVGQSDVMPKLEAALTQPQIQLMLADAKGVVRAPDGSDLDMSDITGARKLAVEVLRRNVMSSALKSAANNSGEAIKTLMKPGIPNAQKVFLRQSNGVANADYISGVAIGQTDVVTGAQDTGAFGKCAPTSFFCGALCGIARSARVGFDTLKSGNGKVKALATELEQLTTEAPLDEAKRIQIHAKLAELKSACAANGTQKAAAKQIEQMVVSFVDRMVVKADERGEPYFEMSFYLPPLQPGKDGYLKGSKLAEYNKHTGMQKTKVYPSDIQQYIEWTNREDGYRGDKSHMMDFFKDPSALNTSELLDYMGVGIIAAGVDKALKTAGKTSGLLYGPGSFVVGSMLYNREVQTEFQRLNTVTAAAYSLIEPIEDIESSDNAHWWSGSNAFKDSTQGVSTAITALDTLWRQKAIDDTSRSEFEGLYAKLVTAIKMTRDEAVKVIESEASVDVSTEISLLKGLYANDPMTALDAGRARNVVTQLERKLGGDPKLLNAIKWCKTDWATQQIDKKIHAPLGSDVRRRDELIQSLSNLRDTGGGASVSMGFNGGNGHVNYVQAWGTPFISGIEIDSVDLARCHMNHQENGGMSSAWYNDRNIDGNGISSERMSTGLKAIALRLETKGAPASVVDQARELAKRADTTCDYLVARANSLGHSFADIDALLQDHQTSQELHPDKYSLLERIIRSDSAYRDFIRGLEADAMQWIQDNLTLKNDDTDLVKDNVLMMAANTERDNFLSDNPEDRDKVWRGNISDQTRGTGNASDATYFVPITPMATGWNQFDPNRVTHYKGADPRDSFIILSSMTVMKPRGAIKTVTA